VTTMVWVEGSSYLIKMQTAVKWEIRCTQYEKIENILFEMVPMNIQEQPTLLG
jgi:hypothetical protein